MEQFVERCAGLDVHRDTVVATVRIPGDESERSQKTRTFATTLPQVQALSTWLRECGVTLVGMEATG